MGVGDGNVYTYLSSPWYSVFTSAAAVIELASAIHHVLSLSRVMERGSKGIVLYLRLLELLCAVACVCGSVCVPLSVRGLAVYVHYLAHVSANV